MVNQFENPPPNYATVHQLPNPGLFESILVRVPVQRGTYEHHSLGDSRIPIVDLRHRHAPIDQAITQTSSCDRPLLF